MCVKDEKEDIIKRSERVRERHKIGNASRCFERDAARRRTRNRIVFTSSFQKFKRETKVPKTKTSSSHNKRAQTKREKERTHI